MITINDNLIYRPYKEESFLDENYMQNQGMKKAIELLKSKIELVAGYKDVTVNVSGNLNNDNGNEDVKFNIICDDAKLHDIISKTIG